MTALMSRRLSSLSNPRPIKVCICHEALNEHCFAMPYWLMCLGDNCLDVRPICNSILFFGDVWAQAKLAGLKDNDDDCDALWAMFDIQDLDEGVAQPGRNLNSGK